MALVIRGSTACAVCDRVIRDGDEIIGLPHFARDESDPHWRYSDAAFHAECWTNLPEREAIIKRITELDRQHGYPPHFG